MNAQRSTALIFVTQGVYVRRVCVTGVLGKCNLIIKSNI